MSNSDKYKRAASMRICREGGQVVETVPKDPEVSGLLKGAQRIQTCSLADVSDVQALTKWLNDQGLDTSDWGKGNTKEVKKFWAEIQGKESGLELWRKADGSLQPVRTTHVLRAKVCSPESFKRGVFLFNTWQQYGDGRRRVRNGLLSEKLTLEEMPLEEHLVEVCERAVTEEEMQRLADPLLKIGPGSPPPEYDKNYVCPLRVVDEFFVDHVIEVEGSKSYPRLLTMYHLYTVDIVCTGLPKADFNTLEFDHPESEEPTAKRPLKYIHAWVWMEWSQIQRYLFEGSTMKERKQRGSFADIEDLTGWLDGFNLHLEAWGTGKFKSVDELFYELEEEESHLELWGRQDGVPLLMRVMHVLQLKVGSTDPRMQGKFIYHTWTQSADGQHKAVNRLMTKKMRVGNDAFNRQRFTEEAEGAVRQQLTYVLDPHFRFDPENPPIADKLEACPLKVVKVTFQDHRVDVENSPRFKGLCTLYHLYTCEVECEGLPHANFASLEVKDKGVSKTRTSQSRDSQAVASLLPNAFGWCWVVVPQCLDMAHSRNAELEEQLEMQRNALDEQERLIQRTTKANTSMMTDVLDIVKDPKVPRDVATRIKQVVDENRKQDIENSKVSTMFMSSTKQSSRRLPPSMVSEMAEGAAMSDDMFASQAAVKELDADAKNAKNNGTFPWCFSLSC
jgi:hypothetical protein